MFAALRGAAEAGPSALREVVVKALADRSAAVVARAATLAFEQGVDGINDPLQTALVRLMNATAKDDPGCLAKVALTSALRRRDATDQELFRKLATFRQSEPGAGDTASPLRAEAALALASAGNAEAPRLLTDLLFGVFAGRGDEDDASDRAAAAIGLGATDWPPAALLLRAKLHAGDVNAAILGECCGGIARLDPPWAADFVRSYLASHPRSLAPAAVPLGESRRAWVYEFFAEIALKPTVADDLLAVLMGLALTRDARAESYLRNLADDPRTARPAAEALRLLPTPLR